MLFAEITLSPRAAACELRLNGLDTLQPPHGRLLSVARDEPTGAVLVLAGRVYYRNDLKRRWRLQLDDDSATPADWALAAFRAGSVTGLDHLEGEYSLMLYEPRVRQLHLHRSAFGDVPLYWCLTEGTVLAGTSLPSLAAQVKCWQIDAEYLGGFLLDPHAPAPRPETTALKPVRRVLPGTRITLDAAANVQRSKFWDWTRCMREEARLSRAEAADRYLEILDGAIGERMNGELTAAELSGGFDSSTVVCRARDRLARGGGRGPLLTVSLDYPFAEMAGEGKYMRLVTDQGGPIEPIFLRDGAPLDYDGFPEEVPAHDEPTAYLFRFALDRRMIDVAAAWGARTLLTGGGSELLVGPGLDFLTDLVRAGQWRQAFRAARHWALDRQTTLGALAWQHFVVPFLPPGLQQGWGVWRRGGRACWPQLEQNTIAPWIKPAFARQARMRELAVDQVRQRGRLPAARSQKLTELRAHSTSWAGWYLAMQRQGILLSHPFLDTRLLAFGLNLPRDVRQQPGLVKPLLAEATRGVLPEPIRTRRYKCGFDRVNLDGFRRALGRIRTFLREAGACDPGIVDCAELERALSAYSQGVGNAVAGNHISAALSLLLWLRQMAKNPPRPGVPSQTLCLCA